MPKLRWGILSTGKIARRLALSLQSSETGILHAVGSRYLERARDFANEFGAAKAYGSLNELINDPEVEAVYIATPHPQHAEWAIKAAQAGKHILCEKPAGMNAAEVETMIAAARENGVFFVEAFMYRCHPQTLKLLEILREETIGEIGLIRCSFGFAAPFNREHRLFANRAGGGAVMDVGCYCVSMARLVAGVAMGKDFAEPLEVKALATLGDVEGTDLISASVMKFPGGIIAQLSTGLHLVQDNCVQIFGSKGVIMVKQPWMAGRKGARILVQVREPDSMEEIITETEGDLYHHELDLVAKYRDQGQPPPPAMTWEDTLGNMRALDAWRREIGLVYHSEKR